MIGIITLEHQVSSCPPPPPSPPVGSKMKKRIIEIVALVAVFYIIYLRMEKNGAFVRSNFHLPGALILRSK